MNSRTAKNIRKYLRHQKVLDIDFMQSLRFRDRLSIAWDVLFGKRDPELEKKEKHVRTRR